jgi:hypothetical protein
MLLALQTFAWVEGIGTQQMLLDMRTFSGAEVTETREIVLILLTSLQGR